MLTRTFARRRGGKTYALLHEDTELALILNLDELLAAIGRVGDVQLFGRKWSAPVDFLEGFPRRNFGGRARTAAKLNKRNDNSLSLVVVLVGSGNILPSSCRRVGDEGREVIDWLRLVGKKE